MHRHGKIRKGLKLTLILLNRMQWWNSLIWQSYLSKAAAVVLTVPISATYLCWFDCIKDVSLFQRYRTIIARTKKREFLSLKHDIG